MILQNIPNELRTLNQWVIAGSNKEPINPRTGHLANVNDPSTWGTFAEAVATGRPVGFVLSKNDPFAIIDLDDPATVKISGEVVANPDLEEVARIQERHRMIFKAFDSYAELSQSNKGIHIIVRASVPKGVRRQKVEVYSDGRYMICTGNVIKALPVADGQMQVTELYEGMKDGAAEVAELEQVQSHLTDDELYHLASTAANADKFLKLFKGEWHGNPAWPSQSEADFALMSMLGFYSPDNEQCRRVFRYSALGKRDKATKNDKYLNFALGKIRAKYPPLPDLSKLIANTLAQLEKTNGHNRTPDNQSDDQPNLSRKPGQKSNKPPLPENFSPRYESTRENCVESKTTETLDGVQIPPGFIGDLARYIYSSSIRPVAEISIASAIALTAGVVGRSFNISGQGLNQYIILLAKTGRGKEGAASGINRMVNAVRPQVPMIDEYMGPSAFASGQALIRVLDKCPCFVSILGEVGLTLQQICSPNANGAQVMLKKVLLDIYAKSGFTEVLQSSVYSDTDKNTKRIQAPNVTIFGESNPEKFYDGLDAGIITEGLLPRFSIFEYTGPRPDTNPNAFHPPPEKLVRAFATLAAVATAAQQSRTCAPVQQDIQATGLLREFDKFSTDQINTASGEVHAELWNRAHLKALKMAALIAVGVNPVQPVVTAEIAEWAIELVRNDVAKLYAKFQNGEIGTGDVRLELDVKRAVKDYLAMSPIDRLGYQCPAKLAETQLVPLQYLRKRLRLLVSFRNDKRGATRALMDTLNSLCDGEVLERLNPLQSRTMFGSTAPVYGLGPAWH